MYAGDVVVGLFEQRLGGGLLRLGGRKNRLERLPIDLVQEAAGADEGPLAEVHRFEEALDARPDLDVLEPGGLANQFQVHRHVLLDHLGDVDFGRGCHNRFRLFSHAMPQAAIVKTATSIIRPASDSMFVLPSLVSLRVNTSQSAAAVPVILFRGPAANRREH